MATMNNIRNLVFGIYVHLTFSTIKLQTERKSVVCFQVEWLMPLRLLASMLHAVTKRITYAMAALHQGSLVEVRMSGLQALTGIKLMSEPVGNVVEGWIFVIFSWQRRQTCSLYRVKMWNFRSHGNLLREPFYCLPAHLCQQA